MIRYNTCDVRAPIFPRRKVTAWIKTVAARYHKKVGDVGYIFCSDVEILKVNAEYLSHDYYTDIITFDYSTGAVISGDMFISLETVCSNAGKYAVPFENELYRVMIHGILHLCGINDKAAAERENMTRCENEALGILTI